MKVAQILDKVKKQITPTEKKDVFEKILLDINESIKKKKLDAVAVFGGSFAKGTNLKNDFDCDIFVKFSLEYKNKDISGLTKSFLKNFKPRTLHGSRDYFQFTRNKIKYEIVPVLDIKEIKQIVNTTDASPLHAEWVREQLTKKPKLAGEIRLLKKFCKAQRVYGAESYIRGFSGHVVDILIIYYGSFLNVLRNSKKWGKKEVIDFYNYHKGKALKNLNSSKKESPIIVIDPIQSNRNAAASLSDEKLENFIFSAQSFLKKPDISFFKKKKISKAEIKKKAKGKILVLFEANPVKGKQDIIGTKMLKAFEYISHQLSYNDFLIYDSGWEWNPSENNMKAVFWIISDKLSKEKEWTGPPSKNKKAVESFRKKHKNAFEKKGRLFCIVKRKYTDPKEFAKSLFKNKQVKSRLRGIRFI